MQKLLRSRKGFTLIELIVVIVIIAILIAALTPAILGVIRRANVAADESDCRTVMMAGSVANLIDPSTALPDDAAQVIAQISGTSNVRAGTYTIFFEGQIAVGCRLPAANTRSRQDIEIGNVEGADLTPFPVPVGGAVGGGGEGEG